MATCHFLYTNNLVIASPPRPQVGFLAHLSRSSSLAHLSRRLICELIWYSSFDNGGSLSGQSLFNYIRVWESYSKWTKMNLKCLGFLSKNKNYYRSTCFRGDNSSDFIAQSLANGGSNSTIADHMILGHKTYFWKDVVKLFGFRILRN